MNKAYMTIRVPALPVSVQIHRRTAGIIMSLMAAVAVLALVSAGLGDYRIMPMDVLRAIRGIGTEEQVLVVQTLRLPRILISMLAGAGLAAAGTILQCIVRNPLAAPDIVGITGGASVGAVFFITQMPGLYDIRLLPVTAMAGALIAALLVYVLAWKRGVSTVRLVLVGIGIAALLSSLVSMLLIMAPSSYSASSAYIWLTGTVYGANWDNVRTLLPWMVPLLILAWFAGGRALNIQQLGDDIAAGAGSAVQRQRLWMLLLAVGLAGSAVSMVGTIGFVGLIAPHMARRLVGASAGGLIPASALIGACILMGADLVGRTMFLPHDVPAGVFTAAIGAPFFIYLLFRTRNAR
ncbi:FecCD family ABC transporter permease [Paenibacillus sp. MMS18-CY102]|uniref:FecCD family ABC transporter permease n=1 Tax=Paenibacillus sp. MMS18-CY102 TaxID=2682849 RepID=UPI001365C08E|nr:iron ABC transporter permease [Paenibacillus sp. MMS18-CY102]MWC29958.1 iron chelate uptake ABC transporter family permease subunit [Paenibacillus sp. MMS18-CY102]